MHPMALEDGTPSLSLRRFHFIKQENASIAKDCLAVSFCVLFHWALFGQCIFDVSDKIVCQLCSVAGGGAYSAYSTIRAECHKETFLHVAKVCVMWQFCAGKARLIACILPKANLISTMSDCVMCTHIKHNQRIPTWWGWTVSPQHLSNKMLLIISIVHRLVLMPGGGCNSVSG